MRRALAVAAIVAGGAVAAQVAEPSDYRMDEYRAPVPDTLAGATVVGPEEAYALWQAGKVAFIDVLPRPPKPETLPAGTIWREPRHLSIPGATWLPNVGYGALAEVNQAYYRDGLARVTNGDPAHPILIFCQQDCWMSWNAAKRALEYGYANVYWLPLGTDGWDFFDYPMQEIEAVPGDR